MARHAGSMRKGIFKRHMGGGPLVLQNEVFAKQGGQRGLPCKGVASIGGVIDKEGNDCRGERLGGGACVKES